MKGCRASKIRRPSRSLGAALDPLDLVADQPFRNLRNGVSDDIPDGLISRSIEDAPRQFLDQPIRNRRRSSLAARLSRSRPTWNALFSGQQRREGICQ